MAKETAEELIARINAKHFQGGSATMPKPEPAPKVESPAPIPQPAQQPQGTIGRAMGILGGRKDQIDKAAGYKRGGIVRGKGTPTSDSIPVNVAGKNINVSDTEAILPGKTVAALGGPAAVEKLIEKTNGKPPVKGGITAGGKYNVGSIYSNNNEEDEYTRAMKSVLPSSAPSPVANPVDTSAGPTVSDGAGGVYTPEKGINPLASVGKFFSDSAKAARGESSYDQLRSQGSAAPAVDIAAPGAQGKFKTPSEFAPKMTDIAVPGTQFTTGAKPGEFPTSAQGGFTQGAKSYNVKDTNQAGITRVTAPGAAPLYTNINPESAVTGLANQQVSSGAEGLARMANANKIRGEMIANRDKDIPAGGYGPGILGDGGIAADNAEKTARWRQDDLIAHSNRGNQATIAAALNATARSGDVAGTNATHLQTAAMQSDAAKRGHEVNAQIAAGRDNTSMRNTDVNAANDKEKNGILAAQVKLPNYSNRYIALPNRKVYNELGQVTGEEPGGMFDAATGQPVQAQGASSPKQEYDAAIAAAKGDPAKIKAINDRARQNGVIQ